MRTSQNQYNEAGILVNGYDYRNQAWVVAGRYVKCGHCPCMECNCYGTLHAGELTAVTKKENEQ